MKKSIRIIYNLFILLLVSLTLNEAQAGTCKEIYYAKTLEGNREVKVCTIGNTLIYQFGKLNTEPELIFSTLKKNVLFDEGPLYDDDKETNIFSLYIPNGNVWYGLLSMSSVNAYNVLTVNRGVGLDKSNYYSKSETLMSYMLDERTIINNLDSSEFTKIEDNDYEENN